MTDYRLDGLSPRLFEHLIQALGHRELTPRLAPFGDGPDGGREASFDGPCRDSDWDGYDIVQCKYRERPARDDGAWVPRELRKELRAFQPGKRRHARRIPEYYIFVTNVALSAVAGTGVKDRVIAELVAFVNKHGP